MKSQLAAWLFLLIITILYWCLILLHRNKKQRKDNVLMAIAMSVAVLIFGVIIII
ncbi:hypothetical protein [Nicoliella lavandulae]|uniref:Uncharacterized protein n=1 Tax=Nicoliella lavandulae TaxID=3082954 RepID=A0ABU8SMM4_9LACO